MRDLGSRLSKQLVSYSEKAGKLKFSIILYVGLILMLKNLNLFYLFGSEERFL